MQTHGWNLAAARASPIGAASLLAFATVALCCVLFDILGHFAPTSPERWVAAVLIIIGYLLFSPAVAAALYSLCFERPKVLAVAAFVLAGITIPTMPSAQMLDALVLLPFWFLGIFGVVKFVRWRAARAAMRTGEG
jgi:hypothetical protein